MGDAEWEKGPSCEQEESSFRHPVFVCRGGVESLDRCQVSSYLGLKLFEAEL